MTLLITLCLLTSATTCEDHRERLLSEVTPVQCHLKAQERIAALMPLYEGYRVMMWRCGR